MFWNKIDPLVEGMYADQYTNENIRQQIKAQYHSRFVVKETPWSHPENFDPLVPPAGWRYDPYYEIWIKL